MEMTHQPPSPIRPAANLANPDDARQRGETPKQRVLVIEDQSAVCDMIAEVVVSHPRCELIGKGYDGADAMKLTEQLRPDILVLDIIMPGLGGFEVLYRLRNKAPQMKVLIFSGIREPRIIRSIMQNRVHGFVHKNQRLAELRNALGAISMGQKWFMDEDVQDAGDKPKSNENKDFLLLDQLTKREREIAIYISRSHTSKEIAKKLALSQKTVENHRTNLMRKLRVNNLAGLVRLMIQAGLS